jgi:hypothetical protein
MPHRTAELLDPNQQHTFEVLFFEFNPNFLRDLTHHGRELGVGGNTPSGESGEWIYQPAENNHMSPIVPHVDQSRTWLAECGADKAVAPYAYSRFKHDYFDREVAQLQNWRVMVDNEHSRFLLYCGRCCID